MGLQIPGSATLDRNLPCALCERADEPRLLSHIIPSFVMKHASVRSPTGYLRTSLTPNRRVQDGPTDYILCSRCEQRFSVWERSFAAMYKGFYENRSSPFQYSDKDALCALSMVWRVLYNARSHPELNHLTFGDDYSRTDSAHARWKDSLLNGKNPGKFRLYWLFFDIVESGDNIPSGINRYIFHGTDFDLMANSDESFVYVHIPGLFIFGMTEEHNESHWRDMRVCFNGATYRHRNRTVPGEVGQIIRSKIAAANAAKDQISPVQRNKIRESALRDPEALLKSPLARASFADIKFEEN